MSTPIPTEYRLRHAEPCPERYRNLRCVSYQTCLDVAVKRGWGDWSCLACARFHEAPPVDLASFASQRRSHE